jgi:hypothetical protein
MPESTTTPTAAQVRGAAMLEGFGLAVGDELAKVHLVTGLDLEGGVVDDRTTGWALALAWPGSVDMIPWPAIAFIGRIDYEVG